MCDVMNFFKAHLLQSDKIKTKKMFQLTLEHVIADPS